MKYLKVLLRQRCHIVLCLVILSAILSSILIYLLAHLPSEKTCIFYLPKDEYLYVSFTGDIETTNTTYTNTVSSTKYNFQGMLHGVPYHAYQGSAYELHFDKLKITDDKNSLIIGFERLSNDQCKYYSNPDFSSKQRQEIYNVFNIDTSTTDISEDLSLFQSVIKCFISNDAQLKEILLTPALRNAIYDNIENPTTFALIRELLSHPEKIPPLIPEGHYPDELTIPWQTLGSPPSPMAFRSHTAKIENNIYHVKTTSLSPHNNQKWTINWDYDPYKMLISGLTILFQDKTSTTSFSLSQDSYQAQIHMELSFKTPPPQITPPKLPL